MAYLDPKTGLPGAKQKKAPASGQWPNMSGALQSAAFAQAAAQNPSGTWPNMMGAIQSAAQAQADAQPRLAPGPTLTQPPEASPAGGVPSPSDFRGLIDSDPLYAQTRADIDAARAADRSQLSAVRQRALIEYGGVPDFGAAAQSLGITGLQDDVTDSVRQLAGANKFSTKQRIQQAHDDAVKSTVDSLTARGILSSGETGYQLGRQTQRTEMANADAVQQLLDYLLKAQTGYSQSENARLAALAAAADQAAGRIPLTSTATPEAAPVAVAGIDAAPASGQWPNMAGALQGAAQAMAQPPPSGTWPGLLDAIHRAAQVQAKPKKPAAPTGSVANKIKGLGL